jgi:hypothetical protein
LNNDRRLKREGFQRLVVQGTGHEIDSGKEEHYQRKESRDRQVFSLLTKESLQSKVDGVQERPHRSAPLIVDCSDWNNGPCGADPTKEVGGGHIIPDGK